MGEEKNLRPPVQRRQARTRRALICATCALLLFGSGFAAAVVPHALAAPAQEEPPITTTPVPDPAPDPAPPVKPKPKPRATPTPTPRRSTPAPAPATQPTYQAPSVQTQKPAVKKPVRKAKKKVVKKAQKKAPVTTEPAVTPTVKPASGALGAAVGLRDSAPPSSGAAFDFSALLIVLGLAIAIACFTVAVIPATHVPWRPAAIFVSERQVDLTLLGFALLTATAFMFFWVKGP
jgi:cytoskeletal protein RodZ